MNSNLMESIKVVLLKLYFMFYVTTEKLGCLCSSHITDISCIISLKLGRQTGGKKSGPVCVLKKILSWPYLANDKVCCDPDL